MQERHAIGLMNTNLQLHEDVENQLVENVETHAISESDTQAQQASSIGFTVYHFLRQIIGARATNTPLSGVHAYERDVHVEISADTTVVSENDAQSVNRYLRQTVEARATDTPASGVVANERDGLVGIAADTTVVSENEAAETGTICN